MFASKHLFSSLSLSFFEVRPAPLLLREALAEEALELAEERNLAGLGDEGEPGGLGIRGWNAQRRASFGGLALGCVEADFCNERLLVQHVSKCKRCTPYCTTPTSIVFAFNNRFKNNIEQKLPNLIKGCCFERCHMLANW